MDVYSVCKCDEWWCRDFCAQGTGKWEMQSEDIHTEGVGGHNEVGKAAAKGEI